MNESSFKHFTTREARAKLRVASATRVFKVLFMFVSLVTLLVLHLNGTFVSLLIPNASTTTKGNGLDGIAYNTNLPRSFAENSIDTTVIRNAENLRSDSSVAEWSDGVAKDEQQEVTSMKGTIATSSSSATEVFTKDTITSAPTTGTTTTTTSTPKLPTPRSPSLTTQRNNATAVAAAAIIPDTKQTPIVFRLQDYKFCRFKPKPQLGKDMVVLPELGVIPNYYQCAGQAYEDHVQIIHSFLQTRYQADPSDLWGRRESPVPSNNERLEPNVLLATTTSEGRNEPIEQRKNKETTRILVMGNSHTRQTVSQLLCQYRHLITNSTELATFGGLVASRFELKDGVTFYMLFNHPLFYSKRWPTTLSLDILGFPFKRLDAIILGTFNKLEESQKSTFLKQTLKYQKTFKKHKVDFHNQPPPYIRDVAERFGGPIIWLSMFAKYNHMYHKQALNMISELQQKPLPPPDATTATKATDALRTANKAGVAQYNQYRRTNIRAVYGRRYITPELHGNECSSDVGRQVSTCLEPGAQRYSDGHRCVGSDGSHVDLITWDLVEALWDVLS